MPDPALTLDSQALFPDAEIGRALAIPEFYDQVIDAINQHAALIDNGGAGAPGPPGPQGIQGPAGADGAQGIQGDQGDPGANTPVLGASALGWYSLADYLVPDSEAAATANSTAHQTLIDLVIAAGGGTIWVPSRKWYHNINAINAVVKLTGTAGAPLVANVTYRGEGDGSILAWGGDAGGGDKDFFQFNSGVWNVTFRDIKITQNREIVNPDPLEQHHLIDQLTAKWSNNENIRCINVTFGVVKGDAFRMVGGQNITAAHASYAGNSVPAAFPGPITNPLFPQRVCVRYAAAWGGGTVTIVGTDPKGNAQTEVIPAPIGGTAQTMIGQYEFKTITSITKQLVAALAAGASVGYDYRVRGSQVVDSTFNGFDFLNADPGYGYRAPISVQRSVTGLIVSGCKMTGSDDQLIDMEPTSNGDVTDCIIVNNILTAHDISAATVTLTGNGSRDAIKRTIFANNIIRGGRVAASDIDGLMFFGNQIDVPLTGSAPGLAITKLATDIQIANNRITAAAGSACTYAISVQRNTVGNDAPNAIVIQGNTLTTPMANGGGIFLEDCGNGIIVDKNIIRNLSSALASGTGVHVKQTSNTGAVHGIQVNNNECEELGGGTLHTAYRFTGNATNPQNICFTGNTANASVRGILIDALTTGTWTGYPVLSCGGLVGCTTPVSLGAGVYAVIGGQQGSVAQYMGAGTPETFVIALKGSTFQRTDGGVGTSFYVKEANPTLATGWAAK